MGQMWWLILRHTLEAEEAVWESSASRCTMAEAQALSLQPLANSASLMRMWFLEMIEISIRVTTYRCICFRLLFAEVKGQSWRQKRPRVSVIP